MPLLETGAMDCNKLQGKDRAIKGLIVCNSWTRKYCGKFRIEMTYLF